MLVHPFDTTSAQEAYEMERQAIGRINRIGQQASSVMVWRVVTENTLEQELFVAFEASLTEGGLKKRRRIN